MLAIIKIQEGYAVVDLDEDTELFESLDEAEDMMLEYMSKGKLHKYQKKYWKHSDAQKTSTMKANLSHPDSKKAMKHWKDASTHYKKKANMQKRLDQRTRAISMLGRTRKLKKAPAV
jgi:hypothetical protein